MTATGRGSPHPLFTTALEHEGLGRPADAELLYNLILDADPVDAACLHRLGVLAARNGQPARAIELIGRAIAIKPDLAEACLDLANILADLGETEASLYACATAAALRPDWVAAQFRLAVLFKAADRLDEAIAAFARLAALTPDAADAHSNLGAALADAERLDEAVVAYRRALVLDAGNALAWSNLGNALAERGEADAAIAAHEEAVRLRPDLAYAHFNLGAVLQSLRRTDAAIACYRRAIALRHDFVEAHLNLSLALLLKAQFKEGWRENEWRLLAKERLHRERPAWQGEALAGRTLLIHCEQGYGDSIQFVRYAALLARQGARVVVEAYPPLVRLFRSIPGVAAVSLVGEEPPPHDYQLSVMSLPRVLGTDLSNIPGEVPYIRPDPGEAAMWGRRLAGVAGLKVGLVWAGDPSRKNLRAVRMDRVRSIRLAQFAPLLTMPGVTLVSLQKGRATAELARLLPERRPLAFMGEVEDFAGTAALAANLDLVISVDTSVAHVAGALGKPVWILSRFDGDWRWLENREDSPWYPNARLFLQKSPGAWDEVIGRVAEALAQLVKDSAARL